jgi:ribA/ribD-fused uncharacterized protein
MIEHFNGEYGFLSNFYTAEVVYEGIEYKSVEHAYQAAKSLDPAERNEVAMASTAGIAKKLGKHVTKRDDWDEIKLAVMFDLVMQKFKNHADLREKLIATGDQELVEGNWWGDRFWGVCKGTGENHLGKILMRVREEVK